MPGIFISHTHSDHALAEAIDKLTQDLFGARVNVNYSSSSNHERSVGPGHKWFEWIVEQVRGTDVAFVLLTPSSIQKPWVLWEAGAVEGVTFAGNGASADQARVVPVTFGLSAADIPNPFTGTQAVDGAHLADMEKLTNELLGRFAKELTPKEQANFGKFQDAALKKYVAHVEKILLTLPVLISEAAIQEWLERFELLEKGNRFSEALVMENWLDVAFGRDEKDKQRPLDVRVHRRLGDLYAKGKDLESAVRQFGLARKLMPRDIFILRRLGKAYLDQKKYADAREILKVIEGLDSKAFEVNAENAALQARLCEETGDLAGARDVLRVALNNNPASYYLGDRLGQIYLALADRDNARETYGRVLRILSELHEQNVWTRATELSAALVRGEDGEITRALDGIRACKPNREELDSITRGAEKLLGAIGADPKVIDALRQMA